MTLVVRNARVVTPAALAGPARGPGAGALRVLERAEVVIDGDRIVSVDRKSVV